jgi:hypothetical protein
MGSHRGREAAEPTCSAARKSPYLRAGSLVGQRLLLLAIGGRGRLLLLGRRGHGDLGGLGGGEVRCVPEDGSWQRMEMRWGPRNRCCRRPQLAPPLPLPLSSRGPARPPRPSTATLRGRCKGHNPFPGSLADPLPTILPPTRAMCTTQPFYGPIQSNSTLLYTWPINDP